MSLMTLDSPVAEMLDFDAASLIDRFVAAIDVKSNSRDTYRRQIKPFIDWICSKYSTFNPPTLCQADVFAYKDALVKSGKSSYTISGYLTAVRKFFEWLESQKIFPNIARGIKGLKKPKGFRKECLTTEQIREALASFDITTQEGLRDYALFNLLVRTGLRTVEVARARVGDLRQQSGEAVLWVQGKGRDAKDEFVLVLDETLRPIRKYLAQRGPLADDAPLFASISNRSKNEPIKERTIRGIIKEALRRIDLDDARISAHSLRHTAVSLSIKGGASLLQAQAMARHSDPKTTLIYFHNQERVQNGAERFVII